MRYAFGILFVLLFAGFVAFIFGLGGPAGEAYKSRDILLGGALVFAVLSAIPLGLLASGVGAQGKKISSWGVPLLCGVPLLTCLALFVLILTANTANNRDTPEHRELGLRILVGLCTMILISLGGLIFTLIRSRRHNSNWAPPATYQPGLHQSNVSANIKRCPACGNTYTDVTLSFCLADGSPLEYAADPAAAYDSEATITFNNK
jgi:apolipoprotein N-acyltransferase